MAQPSALLPDPDDRPLLRPVDVAPVLGVGLPAVYEMVRAGHLPHRRVGKRVFIANLGFRQHMGLPESGPLGAALTPRLTPGEKLQVSGPLSGDQQSPSPVSS